VGHGDEVRTPQQMNAAFHRLVRPGDTITYAARIEQLNEQGASIRGTVTANGQPVADIELMFSHIDQNMAGLAFPEHNFVFGPQFMDLLQQSGFAVKSE